MVSGSSPTGNWKYKYINELKDGNIFSVHSSTVLFKKTCISVYDAVCMLEDEKEEYRLSYFLKVALVIYAIYSLIILNVFIEIYYL